MGTFFIVLGIIIWILAIFALVAAGVGCMDDDHLKTAIGSWIAALLLLAGLITFAANNIGDDAPPDGCYRISHDTDYMPGAKGTVIPYDDVNYIPINC